MMHPVFPEAHPLLAVEGPGTWARRAAQGQREGGGDNPIAQDGAAQVGSRFNLVHS